MFNLTLQSSSQAVIAKNVKREFLQTILNKRLSRFSLVITLIASVLLIPMTAQAEGSFNSYLTNVSNGFISRTWPDKDLDNASTTTYAAGCSRSDDANFVLKVELRKDQFGPDKSYGSKSFDNCKKAGVTRSWGRVGAGKFFDQI